MLMPQDVGTYKISWVIQLYEKNWATLFRVTTSIIQVNFESEEYRKDFARFLSRNCLKCDFHLASLIDMFPNKVDNISTTDASSF
jgi:hypothetical protein